MKKKPNKAVKTFTVDEGVYDWVIATLKRADIGVSVSTLLDGYLKYIYQALKEVLTYIEKNKIDLPMPYIVHKVLDECAITFKYNWEVIERLDKEKGGMFEQDIDDELKRYVADLVEEYEEEKKRQWWKKPFREIFRVDRQDKEK